MAAGIVAYAAYIPYFRIEKSEYRKAWGSCAADIREKAVADIDEDAVTMMVEAGRQVLVGVDPAAVEVLALASTTFPYAEGVTAATLVTALGLKNDVSTLEFTDSARAGTGALINARKSLEQRGAGLALVLAADNPVARPGDELEHGLGAGACALLLALEDVAVRCEGEKEWVQENLGVQFRRFGEPFRRDAGIKSLQEHAGKSTLIPAVRALLSVLDRRPEQYRYAVFSQTGGRRTLSYGKMLGFGGGQMEDGMLFPETGDTGAASALLGLCAVLDRAQEGELILLAGYGSGAGAHAISLRVEKKPRRPGPAVRAWLERKRYIDYVQYLKIKRQIL